MPSKKTSTKSQGPRGTKTALMNRDLHTEAKLVATRQGRSLQALVEEAVGQYLSALKKRV